MTLHGPRHRLVAGRLAALFAVVGIATGVAGCWASSAAPAGAVVTGDAGPVTVTVSPTSGLTDGEPVSVHVTAPDGVVIYEIAAHMCLPDSAVNATINFSFVGDFCSNAPVGTSDTERVASFPDGVRSGDLDGFKVGVGSTLWVSDLGKPHFLTCGPGNPCDLVVQVQITNDTVFLDAPLCFGGSCPPEAGSQPSPAPAASGAGSGASPPAAVGAAAPSGDGPGTTPPSTVTPPTTAATAGKGQHSSPTSPSSSSSSRGDTEVATASSRNAAVVGDPGGGLSRGVRVVIAAAVGALCAVRIFFVILRVRRRSSGLGTT
jgi:hypothetical protein